MMHATREKQGERKMYCEYKLCVVELAKPKQKSFKDFRLISSSSSSLHIEGYFIKSQN